MLHNVQSPTVRAKTVAHIFFCSASRIAITVLQVCLLCARAGGCSARTLAGLLATAASLTQVRRYQFKSPADVSSGCNVRAGSAVTPVAGGSGAGPEESACRVSRKDGSRSRKDGSRSQTDGSLSPKDGLVSRRDYSSKVHTDDSSPVEQQGAITRGANPPPIALTNRGDAFEGAVTRLAGAAELGTESRIYVRRADVAEIIDALMDHARVSAGSGVASPALARLSIMRRSRRREARGKRRDGRVRRSACSPEVRVIEEARGPSIGQSRSQPSPASSFFGIANGSDLVLLKEGSAPAAPAPAPGGKSETLVSHPLSQASTVYKVDDGAAAVRRARGGGRGGDQGRWRSRTRSPPPPASLAPMVVAQKASPPSTATAAPTAEVLRTGISVTPSGNTTRVPMRPAAACGTTGGKITRVPIRPVTAGTGADFEDFWSSGWG